MVSLLVNDKLNAVYEQARRDYVNRIADMSSRPINVPYLYSGRVLENLRPLVTDMVPSIRYTAAIALGRMAAQNEKIAKELLSENIILPLLSNLNCKSKEYKRAALFVLRSISHHSSELAEQLVQRGVIESVILCLEDFDPKVREASCWAAEYIAKHSLPLAKAVFDAAAVPMLMVCLREPELSLKAAAAAAVCAICRHSMDLAQACVDAAAVPCLAMCAKNPDFRLKRQAFMALSEIAKHSPDLAELIVEAELFPEVLTQTAHTDDLTRKHAAILVREVVKHSTELAEFVTNSGGVAALVNMLEKTKESTRLPAIMALGYIGAQKDQLASVIISAKGMHQLAASLCEEEEDHILAATVWSIGQIGKHSSEHAKAAALANVFSKMVKLYCSKSSSEDLKQKSKHSLKMILQKCTHLSALEKLLEEAPLAILKYVLGQFSKVLPHDSRARRLFVTTGGLRKVQQLVAEPGTPLYDYKTIINLCFPEEIVNYYSPAYSESLLKRLEVFEPNIPPEVLLADRPSSQERPQGFSRCPYYQEPLEDENQLPLPYLIGDGVAEPMREGMTGSLQMEEVNADGQCTDLDDLKMRRMSKESIGFQKISPMRVVKSEEAPFVGANPRDKAANAKISSQSAPAVLGIPLVEIGRRTPASDVGPPSED
ncbi:sperm-associated antigen 6-like [Hetaerina americana]|uniref:sperm-associated antigen 6-like n=1 Tax=Hetaerina americana TaxID=62018 RepID=UPI003A7F1300